MLSCIISKTFLVLNGRTLEASDAKLVVGFLALAAGELVEEELADRFCIRLVI